MEAVSEPMSSDPSKHRQELGERLDKLRSGEGFCDITISVKGKDFKAHKAVLAATSPFFLTLLTNDMKESSEQLVRIELEEATEAVMEDVFKYVYTGNVLVTEERAHNLIATANYLLLPGLKTMAGNFLKDFVTTENCIFNYYFAEKYQCLELKEGSGQVINSNFTVVMETEDFLKLEVKQVLEWVSSDDITVNAEDDVFKGIVRWVSHSKSEREGDLPELLHQVRLTSVSHDFLLNEIIKEELITKNTEFRWNFLADAMKVILSSIDGHIQQQPRKCLETRVDGIFVCGGTKVLCYIPKQNVWHKLADAPFDYQSNCPVQCGSKVYIFGPESHKLGDSLVMEYYLPDVNSWGSVVGRRSYYSTYAVLKGFLYVMPFGEIYTSCTYQQSVYRYDPGTNCWVQLKRPPFKKSNSCVVSDEEHIYVIGGRKDHNVVSTTSRLDPSNKKWEDVASLSEERENAFGAAMNGKVYVAGGRDGWRAISSCEVYNPLTNEWQMMPSLNKSRCNASMVCCEGRLYVLGGVTRSSSTRSLTVEEFDSERKEWVEKSAIPVDSFESSEEQKKEKKFQACFVTLYKQVIDKLKPLN